jgi:hypothetical protein
MSDVQVDDVARYVSRKLASGAAAWSVKGHLTVLSSIFRYASRRLGYEGVNPVAMLYRGERPSVSQWENLRLSDLDEATIRFTHQVDRKGARVPLKTEESKATLPLPRAAALMLLEHKARSLHTGPRSFVFATRTGKAISQRDVLRALYRAQQRARGAAAMACDDAEEARDLLRHKNSNVTRAIYRAHFDDRRREAPRARMESRNGKRKRKDLAAAGRSLPRRSGRYAGHSPYGAADGSTLDVLWEHEVPGSNPPDQHEGPAALDHSSVSHTAC